MKNELTSFENTLQKIDTICNDNNLGYIVIGGVAIMHHLEYRTTRDIDISLCLDFENIRATGEIFLNYFNPVYEAPLDFFDKYFVLPLSDRETGIRVDLSAGLGGFEQSAVHRGVRVQFSEIMMNVCSVEDLIIFKLVAARPIDLADVEMLVQKYSASFDLAYLKTTAQDFVQLERADIPERLELFLQKYRR